MATTRRTRGKVHRIVIPNWHPCRLNDLYAGHWARRARLKRADRELIGAYARLQAIPRATGKRRVALTITLGPRQRAADCDAYHKSLLDALVHTGILLDDSPAWCELSPVQFRRGERGTEITLTDLEAR
jgi:hypothetical protein